VAKTAWQAADSAIETVHDTMLEQFGNIANYNVVTGCTLSYSGANLQVTVAAGTITHDGSTVSVAGNTVTLVADGSNPRWTWIVIGSGGTAAIVSGTPAATPTVPEVGDNVEIALVYVNAGATIASSQTGGIGGYSRRLILPQPADTSVVTLASDQASADSTTLGDITGLAAAVAANTNYVFRAIVPYYAEAADDYKFGITVPAAATIHALVEYPALGGTASLGTITASGGSVSANGYGAAIPGVIRVTGVVINGANAGNIQFQHARVAGAGTVSTLTKARIETF
jgi:hypothetical protein